MVEIGCSPLLNGARRVVERIQAGGGRAFWVGGAVRDLLRGVTPGDVDIVTDLVPEKLAELFESSEQIGKAFGVTLVKLDGFAFEVATAREERCYLDGRHPESVRYTDDFEVDSARRDFTVNALLLDPLSGKLTDYHGGLADLDRGIIRTVGEAEIRFNEDYLRILRGVRFSADLGFQLEESTRLAMSRVASKCAELAMERVRMELDRILLLPRRRAAFELMLQCGILTAILPELARLSGLMQHPIYHPEGDVFTHTMMMLERMSRPDATLGWSILLHDVGKKTTQSLGKDGYVHFYSHEVKSAEMAKVVLRRFRFSSSQQELIVHAVRNHMKFASVKEMRDSTLKRFIAVDGFAMELELHRLDCMCSHRMMDIYLKLLDTVGAQNGETALPEPLMTGKDLIQLGFSPGPEFKSMLELVEDARLSGKIHTFAEAVSLIKSTYRAILPF